MKTNILKVFGFAALLGVAQGAFATVVTTEAELEAALAAGGTVTLGADIALTHEHQVGNTVVLDLATYCLTAADGVNAFQVIANGNFTVNADETNPGGITTDDNRCCIYTSYGWNPGQKSVTINNGTFFGNLVFNWSPTIGAQAAAHYGVSQGGGGSGGKSVPTTVIINGGVFDGGYELGNIGCYQCYYFTVNGGTFERGIESADTDKCSIGVTTTCKAFFKGGRYRFPYPCDRIPSQSGRVIIGDGYTTYVYHISGDYYCLAPNTDGCEVTGKIKSKKLRNLSDISAAIVGHYQEWYMPLTKTVWSFKTFADAQNWNATDIQYVNSGASNGASNAPSQTAVSLPKRMTALAAPKKLMSVAYVCPAASGNGEDDVLKSNCEGIRVSGISDFTKDGKQFGTYEPFLYVPENPDEEGCVKWEDDDGEGYSYFLTRADLDCCYGFGKIGDYDFALDQNAEKNIALVLTFDKVLEADVELYYCWQREGVDEPALEFDADDDNGSSAKLIIKKGTTTYVKQLGNWQTGFKSFNAGLPLLVALKSTDKAANASVVVSAKLKAGKVTGLYPNASDYDIDVASFTHCFRGGDEPVPLVEKEAEIVVPKPSDVTGGDNGGLKIVEVQDDGTEENVVVSGDWAVPRNEKVNAAVYELNNNTVAPTLAKEETGLGEVPVEEDESPATEDKSKFLKINLTGIAVLKPVVVEEKSVAPLGAVEYDVTPKLKTITTVEEVKEVSEREITNDEIAQSGKSITFKLPLTDDFRVSAKVRHESGDPKYPPEEFICPVLGVAGGRYVEITTTHFSTFTLSPYNAVVTESDETLGIVKVAKTAGGETVAGVPFKKFDASSGAAATMTVDQLLVAGFGEGDDIYAYNPTKPSGDEYDMWAWDGEKWDIVPGPTQPPAAESAEIASGKAFWFKDESGSTTPLTLAGLYQENVTTTTDAGTAGVPKMTLLVNPYNVPVNATEKIATGAATGDQIVFVNGSGRYEFKEGEGWGTVQATEKTVTIGGQTRTVRGPDQFVAVEGGLSIPAGQAFWYVSKGGNPMVAW